MTNTEMIKTIETLQEWENLLNEAKEQVSFYEDQIKEEMTTRNVEEIDLGSSIVRWTSILSSRFDTKNFKEKYSELYKQYTKEVPSRRFTISC